MCWKNRLKTNLDFMTKNKLRLHFKKKIQSVCDNHFITTVCCIFEKCFEEFITFLFFKFCCSGKLMMVDILCNLNCKSVFNLDDFYSCADEQKSNHSSFFSFLFFASLLNCFKCFLFPLRFSYDPLNSMVIRS